MAPLLVGGVLQQRGINRVFAVAFKTALTVNYRQTIPFGRPRSLDLWATHPRWVAFNVSLGFPFIHKSSIIVLKIVTMSWHTSFNLILSSTEGLPLPSVFADSHSPTRYSSWHCYRKCLLCHEDQGLLYKLKGASLHDGSIALSS